MHEEVTVMEWGSFGGTVLSSARCGMSGLHWEHEVMTKKTCEVT